MKLLGLLKQSVVLTIKNPVLWVFGIFLSSGFNLHVWTRSQLFPRTDMIDSFLDYLSGNNTWAYYFLGAVLLVVGLFVANLFKIIFLHKLHNLVHSEELCMLCARSKDKTSLQVLRSSTKVLFGAILSGFITLIVTLASLSTYKYYSLITDGYDFKLVLLALSLGVILVAVSLWNLFTVLFMFWYGLSFSRSAGLSVEFLLSKISSLLLGVLSATVIFFFLVLSVGWLLMHFLPSQTAWLGIVLFAGWLILNNVWFNVVMILLFDDLVKGKKYEQKDPAVLTSLA